MENPNNITQTVADKLRSEIQKVIVGQSYVIDHAMIALFSGGHVLLEGVPGTAKTLLVKTMALAMTGDFKRIQFTPDLMPSDVVGTNVFDAKSSSFVLKKGPIFTNLALIDEVNRAPAKTQAALLEVMEERQVTIDGMRYPLSEPFIVFATQNPIEYEGTYVLPEAQLDRFMFKILIDYPAAEEENQILRNYHHGFTTRDLSSAHVNSVVTPADIERCRAEIQSVKIEESVIDYITQIVRKTRDYPSILVGASPRAAVSLLLAAKARTAMRGVDYVNPDDIKFIARPVLRHRIMLQPEMELEGIRADEVIGEILNIVPVPR
ncbi:MoxR family ATPase [bacterium]|nr:MoxR family ATPase [bacterium]